jgi:feruloyl-CoA synthase
MNLSPKPAAAPYRAIAFGAVDLDCEALPDGGFRLRSRTPLAAHDPALARMFRAAVEQAPDRIFLAERCGDGWRRLTEPTTTAERRERRRADRTRGFRRSAPLILSGSGIDHAPA